MNIKTISIALSLLSLMSCSSGGGGSPVSTPAPPDVGTKSCISEAELLKPGIVGGSRVENFDLDSKKVMLLIAFGAEDDKGDRETSLCTASAIAPNVLLTAAHCIAQDHIAFFHNSLSCESGADIKGQSIAASDAVVHEKYIKEATSSANSANDVAIVILSKNIPSGYQVLKIADPDTVDFTTGELKFIGYGNVNYKAGGSGILRKTTIPITQVKSDLGANIVRIDQSQSHGVCSGDSGGPSIVKVNGQEQILGINSTVGTTSEDEADACRDKATQSLAFGHKAWIKSTLLKRGIIINL